MRPMITRPDAMLPVFAHHLCALSVRSYDPQGQDRVDGQNVKRFHKGLWEVFGTRSLQELLMIDLD